MVKRFHEIRDPIHVFIRLSTDERKIVDSAPFQRLRHIHQLALTYLVYPGATHKRFEHSLGVMELASRVFDVITQPDNLTDKIKKSIKEITNQKKLIYWKQVLRVAALCHDLGHLPFSHAAEDKLLPKGWNHERLTMEIIRSDEMKVIWNNMELQEDDIIKLALGPKKAKDFTFSTWERILADIIVGDSFGVDRMDYLLRDSYHAGVAYGKFDHYRLIDTLRILPTSPSDKSGYSQEPVLGIEQGGLQSAEALLLARYFMYSQVYYHPVRRIYDIHLIDFLKSWLPTGYFPTDVKEHLKLTDNEITSAMSEAIEKSSLGYDHARRIIQRQHFKLLYQRNPDDFIEAARKIYNAACIEFDEGNLRKDSIPKKDSPEPYFPVLIHDGRIISSLSLSQALRNIPNVIVDYVFVEPTLRDKAEKWLNENREKIVTKDREE